MPVVTSPPVQISASDPEFRQSRSEFNPDYLQVGTNLYQVLVAAQASQRKLGVFKRATSNVGGAWVVQDSSNSPDAGFQVGYLYPVYNSSTGIIRVFYILTGDSLFHYCDFDTNTDTWGAPIASSSYAGASGVFNRSFLAYQKSNGDYVGLFNTSTDLYFFTVIGGVSSAITSLLTATATLVGNGVVDGADGFGFPTQESGTIISYRYLDVAFTLSAATALTGSRSNTRVTSVAFSTGIAIAYTLTNGDVVARVSPSFTVPVFTNYTVYSTISSDENTSYASIATGIGADLNLFFVVTNYNVSPIVDEWRQSTFNGTTWPTPIVFYDETANPPPDTVPDPTNQFLHTGNFIELTAGWTGATTMETEVTGTQWCTGFFLEGGEVAPGTLTLVKVITPGGIAVTTDFNLKATGPDTVQGAGGVGPVSVTPGTYALSESALAAAAQAYIGRGFVCIGGTQVGQDITIGAGDAVVCTIINDPVILGAGGRGFIHFKLTAFDGCLGREYRLYERIDRQLLACGVKPACFCVDEREWGTHNDDDEMIPGAPAGSIAFNPSGQITLPTTASGDNVIFQFIVPVGYDGIILGQFHGYYRTPVGGVLPPNFFEGSGDIIWRLSANGRFLRDCGNMLVSLGSIRTQSPVAGGLQLRSQDIVRYIVNVPNTSGSLAPGQGSIVAGLHGYFWPRGK